MIKILYKVGTRTFLALAIVLAILPFLDQRVLRMAGDEKVYLTTAVEMARAGNWFVQTLADEPNYFKGPLHYLFTRVGMLIFGNHLIAGVWMNLALAVASGIAMHRLGRRRWGDKSGLLLGVATGLNVGVFSHALASQMEVELCALYGLATAALGLATKTSNEKPNYRDDVWFWAAAGVIGWAKSPLHSVLVGVGGLVYWALTKQLWSRARTPASWLAALTGVAIGILGYLPAAILDTHNFWETYILREQFQKANNHRTWDYVTKPLLYFLLPWTFIVLAAIPRLFKIRKTSATTAVDVPMAKLGLAMSVPTLLFWATWTYKGQNYNLPAIPALLLLGWACFNGNIPRNAYRAAGVLGVVAFAFLAGVVAHFWPLPAWWGRGWLFLGFASMAFYSLAFILSDDVRVLATGAAAFFLAFGAIITPPGEREMLDMRAFLKKHPDATLHYYNLDPSIWSEWALLQLALHHTVYGLHKPAQLADAVKPGHAVLVQNTANLNVVMNYWRENSTLPEPKVIPWARWLTKGTDSGGRGKWKTAWEARDLKQLEREYSIIWFAN